MALIRTACFCAATLLLGGGYIASQLAFLSNTAIEHSARIDVPSVRTLSLVILVLCIVFAFVHDEEGRAG